MTVSKINDVALRKKTFSFKTTQGLSCFSEDCKFIDGEIKPTFSGEGLGNSYLGSAKNFYNLKDGRYFVAASGYLYKFVNDTYEQITNFTYPTTTKALKVLVEGVEKTLFIHRERVVDGETGTVLHIPNGKCVMMFRDSLFLTEDKKVYFSKPFNHTDFSTGANNGGYFNIDEGWGKVLGLTNNGEDVFVLCANGIIKISFDGARNDCSMKKLSLPNFSVKENTAKEVGSALCFIDGENLKVFRNGKIKSIPLPLENINYVVKSTACYKNYYCVTVEIDGKVDYYTLLVDVETGENYFVSKTLYDGGYYLDKSTHEFMQINEDLKTASWSFEVSLCDFNEHANKKITDVELESDGVAELKITGKGETKIFSIQSGCNKIKTNIVSDVYSIEIKTSAGSTVKNVKFKYVLLGE